MNSRRGKVKMHTADLVSFYGWQIVFFMCIIWFCIRVLKNKNVIYLDEAVSKKTAKRVNIIAKIVGGIIFALIFVWWTIPAIQDIPFVIENKYKTVTGYAVSEDSGRDTRKIRSFTVEDENHKRIHVSVYAENVYVGDYMKIVYLPHMQVGTVIGRSKKDE